MRTRLGFMILLLLLVLGATASPASATTPAPVITGMDPETCVAGEGDLTLVVHGTGFVAPSPTAGLHPSVVRWDGTAVATVVDSGTRLTAHVPESLIRPGFVPVTVFNQGSPPLTTDAESKPHTFVVAVNTPAISGISPSSATAGGTGFDLTVDGSRFYEGSVVLWGAVALPTTFHSTTRLTAAVAAVALSSPGVVQVTVRNGLAGSPVSGPAAFTVVAKQPLLTAISPTQVWAGYVRDDLVLTATGSSFLSGAHITFGGVERSPTTFGGPTQLTLPLTAVDLATAGTIAVGVKNPDGGTTPTTLPLTVAPETSLPLLAVTGGGRAWHNTPVTLTFSASDEESGVQKTQYRWPPAVLAWTDGAVWTSPKSWQGSTVVGVRALDWCGNTSETANAVVHVDMTRPVTKALNAPVVRPRQRVTLKYRVKEPPGLSPTAKVRIKVWSDKTGNVVMARNAIVPVNSDRSWSFKPQWPVGTYRWYVYATDLAGNTQAKPPGWSTVTVTLD